MQHPHNHDEVLVLAPGQGRTYHLGPMTAVFKADENETNGQYSISEWWLEPGTEGPHAHLHEDKDQLFYILEGIVSVFLADKWIEAEKGMFIRIARHTMHTFANRTNEKAGMLNIDIPGGFERDMPAMEAWFKQQ
jgi:mannose-6-phosphate isomerase-like protein (cupin superfamily)